MSKNFRRKSSAKSEPKSGSVRDLKESLSSLDWESEQFQLILGAFVTIIAIFLFLSFASYLFTGVMDQDIIQKKLAHTMHPETKNAQNIFGVAGAYVAHWFIYNLFGIAAFGWLPVLLLAGVNLLTKDFFRQIHMNRFGFATIFYVFFTSIFLGYWAKLFDLKQHIFAGNIGFVVNEWMFHIVGFGGIFIYFILFFSWLLYFHKVKNLRAKFATLFPYVDEKEQQWKEDEPQEVEDTNEDTVEFSPVAPIGHAENSLPREDPATPLDEETPPSVVVDNHVKLEIEPTHEEPVNIPLTIEPTLPNVEVDADNLVETYGKYDPTLDLSTYKYPHLGLVKDYQSDGRKVSEDELEANKNNIIETMRNFNIGIASIKATIGPTVTLYEIVPEAGVRISKIKSLEENIALNLAALGIRIIAPMPGKGTIGIEVPNKNREVVTIKSVLASEKFQKSTFELPIILGKTISNEIYISDLAKMPHLLMAGATGQGKSVGLNVILASLLYKKHPSQVKFVLVDPKKVELTLFNKIERHFLAMLPNAEEAIITDTKKVIHTLNSLCIEMDSRYDLLKDAGVRNIGEYNAKFVVRKLSPEKGHRFLPYIVLVIDELADLMMTAGKEVEQPIARLAQLARAIGIHLIVATQRPSVNVITGLIKANFPARLSFKVTSKIDSRTILDTGGSEQLVGSGDMLLSMGSDMIRLQGPFVDTPEIDDICEFIGSQRGYESAYLLPEFYGDDEQESGGPMDMSEMDPLFDEAARLLVSAQQGSTSLIQRKMKLGYNRAGRIIDQLEQTGIVGPFEGSKAREVIIKDLVTLEEMLKSLRK
ncbi:MAG: DNA translocase FtsK 4TM domain-containing protein [Spirosomataceae bacterium]